MSRRKLVERVLQAAPSAVGPGVKIAAVASLGLGAAGIAGSLVSGRPAAAYVALLVSTVVVAGLGVSGPVLSAIFQLTGAKWGRAYRRLAEGSLVLMPLAVVGVLLLLGFGGDFLPWAHAHHLQGGRAAWLVRGFWDARVLGCLGLAYGVSLWFLYYSFRRDFCLPQVRRRFDGGLGRWLARGIEDGATEALRCERRLAVLAPAVCIVFATCFSLLGFDLVMALDPTWISTLFGAWHFIGALFSGLALLVLASLGLRRSLPLSHFLTAQRQRDLATLLFAFTLVNTDFFWSQYLTIWYGNLPEETAYLITRERGVGTPWASVSWLSLGLYFLVPFSALLFRKVKSTRALLGPVAVAVVLGIFLARFVEIAPPILAHAGAGHAEAHALHDAAPLGPLAASALALLGCLGLGWYAFHALFTRVPIMPIGDEIFAREFGGGSQGTRP